MNRLYDAIVIGAGQAGLAAGYHLQEAGLRFVILEAGSEPVGSWPRYFDSVALNSSARYSSLPGLSFPGPTDRYPARDEVVAYLRHYAAHFRLPIVTGARVSQIERRSRLFRVVTAGQGCFVARTVVAATGFFGHPYRPDLPGLDQFQGRVLHMADYRRPEPFQGQRVVVVGGANGAVQVGTELAQVAKVTLATRHPIRYVPQRFLGQDIHFWLRLTGLDGRQWLNDKSMLVYDTGQYRALIRAARPDRRPMMRRFTCEGIIWSDGRRETVDTVMLATGYRPHLPYLAGLGALDQANQVLHRQGVSRTVPGLYYVGLLRQRSVASTTLRGVGADAQFVVSRLKRYCQAQQRRHRQVFAPGVARQTHRWAARSSELVNLISLIRLALAQQSTSSPRLVGAAALRAMLVGAGFLGFGSAAGLYAQR